MYQQIIFLPVTTNAILEMVGEFIIEMTTGIHKKQ